MVLLHRIGRRALDAVPGGHGAGATRALRRMAVASLACWIGAITAGRLLAYTYSRLTALG
jgi:hypothetical protein